MRRTTHTGPRPLSPIHNHRDDSRAGRNSRSRIKFINQKSVATDERDDKARRPLGGAQAEADGTGDAMNALTVSTTSTVTRCAAKADGVARRRVHRPRAPVTRALHRAGRHDALGTDDVALPSALSRRAALLAAGSVALTPLSAASAEARRTRTPRPSAHARGAGRPRQGGRRGAARRRSVRLASASAPNQYLPTPQARCLAPDPVRFPRAPIDIKLAVLLLRSTYETVDALDMMPWTRFRSTFEIASERVGALHSSTLLRSSKGS